MCTLAADWRTASGAPLSAQHVNGVHRACARGVTKERCRWLLQPGIGLRSNHAARQTELASGSVLDRHLHNRDRSIGSDLFGIVGGARGLFGRFLHTVRSKQRRDRADHL
ncbi:hypothetical protein PD5205_00290 [Xanthomonas fragariae]|uniref:Uncharacterized protein n=1 Tax=Xanthomonas fragariae TaxID=48664 RepID=A0A1Y6GTJ6_9XANT|nr:hypothetical protein NBC2815_00207 [Xanthomonas fragariae]SMR00938.1 hypothetical protein PD885_03717 [Xanthomonas fragariae]SMR01610.1 hypothetical protein PD5205_00290 [Xanthomonas fragariae]